jgi:hypothetical protein
MTIATKLSCCGKPKACRAELVRIAPDDEQAKDRLLFVWLLLGDRYGALRDLKQSAAYYRRVISLAEKMPNPGQPNQPFEKWVTQAKEGLARIGSRGRDTDMIK